MPVFGFVTTGFDKISSEFGSAFESTSTRRAQNRGLIPRFAAITGDERLEMTPAQSAAFQAGSGVTANSLLIGIASVVVVLAFVWVIWVTLGTFRAWQAGDIALVDLMWSTLRASIVLLVLGFYLR